MIQVKRKIRQTALAALVFNRNLDAQELQVQNLLATVIKALTTDFII